MKRILKILLAGVLLFSQVGFSAGCKPKSEPELGILHEKYAENFKTGFAINHDLLDLLEYQDIYKHFNSMTAENEMKWRYLRPNAFATSFNKADDFIEKARELGIGMRGHALVWHHASAVPTYITSTTPKDTLLGYIEEHIDGTIKHFGDDVIYAWDVVNEAITDDNSSQNIYRSSSDASGGASFFYDIAGEDFIFTAFRQAQKTVEENDLDIKLFYNDYNMNETAKRNRAIKMIRKIKEAGIRIDGIGMQGHYNVHTYKEKDFRTAIEAFIAEGLEVHITELDISIHKNDASRMSELTPQMEEAQAAVYKSIYKVCSEYPEVTSVTTWGVADNHTWLDDYPVVGRKNWPLLFNESFKPKKAMWAIME